MIQDLLKRGADARFIDDPEGVWGSRARKGPLHVALRQQPQRDKTEELANWISVVRTLLEAKADVNEVSINSDWRGCGSEASAFDMAMPFAVEHGDFLELFLQHGADPNTKRYHEVHSMRTDGRTEIPILHEAVKVGQLEAVRTLLDHGAAVDAYAKEQCFNERGFNRNEEETALHLAAMNGDLAMCALLLARGANVNAICKRTEHHANPVESPTDDPRSEGFVSSVICKEVEETALHVALRSKHSELVTLLRCSGADAMPLRRDGESTSCVELCGDDETLIQALQAEWSPEKHHLFPAEVRESVKTALLIAQRQKWPVPETVLFKVCAMFAAPEGSG